MCLVEQIAEAVEQTEGDECANRHECQELDQGFEGDGQDHSAVMLGDIEVAGAEEDGEQREHNRHDECRVARAGTGRLDVDAAQYVHAEHDALKLQGDVGQHPHQADQGDHYRQRLRLAVPRRDEVGD